MRVKGKPCRDKASSVIPCDSRESTQILEYGWMYFLGAVARFGFLSALK